MKFKKLFSALLIATFIMSFTACVNDNYEINDIKPLSQSDADATLKTHVSSIGFTTKDHPVDLDSSIGFFEELPDINAAFKFSVTGKNQKNIEVWASTERSGEGVDGWINVVTENFNRQNFKNAAGQTVSVSIRSIDAGAQLDYLTLSNHRPDAWSPANGLWHEMAVSRGVPSVLQLERTVGNTAGILMKKAAYDDYISKYGSLKLDEMVEAASNQEMVLGFTNPYTSDTALNMLTQILLAIDPKNPLSENAASKFNAFQRYAPPPAYTTAQMRESAVRGLIDVMTMECQAYINAPALSDFVFTPFGVRHDNPVYRFEDTPSDVQEVLDLWCEFITNTESQKLGTEYGFNLHDDYKGMASLTGVQLYEAQALWKANKSGGMPVAAVFVCDVSGSMQGNRIHSLRQSLLNSMQYINEDASIGLVSYSNKVTIELPIDRFTGAHRGKFQSAVKSLNADGGTHTYSATAVALDMIREHQKYADVEHRYMIFVLSDGENNGGLKESVLAQLVVSYDFPIHTIGYSTTSDGLGELQRMAGWSEGFTIEVDEENVIYNMRNMFNSQM